MSRWWWTAVAVAVVALVAVGCSGGGPAPDGGPNLAEGQLPRWMSLRDDRGYRALAATEHHLVAIGGFQPGTEPERLRTEAAVVDLRTGRAQRVALPTVPDGVFDPIRAVGTVDGVVVLGAVCADVDHAREDAGCEPGRLASFRLDPERRRWRRLALPGPVAELPMWDVDELQAVREGASVTIGGQRAGGGRVVGVLWLSGGRWRFVADPASDRHQPQRSCAASDARYLRTIGARSLRVVARDGARSTIALPELPPGLFGGVVGQLGCTARGPVVVGRVADRPVVARWWDGRRWRPLAPAGLLEGTTGEAAPVSGPEGVVVPGQRSDGSVADVAVDRDGRARPLRWDRRRDDRVLWLGGTSRVLLVRPDDRGARFWIRGA